MAEIVKYETGGNEIQLSNDIVRRFLVSGNGNVSDKELGMFIALCKYQKLNPFLRDVYLIKYGNSPATMVTGKEAFLKRAQNNPKYRGHKTGLTDDGKTAWAEVHVEGYAIPIRCEVDYAEYVGKKSDGSPNRMWAEKPRTMLKKVALVQALREAFPDTFGGMYSQEEINTISDPLPVNTIEQEPDPEDPPEAPRGPNKAVEQESDKDVKKAVESVDAVKTAVEAESDNTMDFAESLKIANRYIERMNSAKDITDLKAVYADFKAFPKKIHPGNIQSIEETYKAMEKEI